MPNQDVGALPYSGDRQAPHEISGTYHKQPRGCRCLGIICCLGIFLHVSKADIWANHRQAPSSPASVGCSKSLAQMAILTSNFFATKRTFSTRYAASNTTRVHCPDLRHSSKAIVTCRSSFRLKGNRASFSMPCANRRSTFANASPPSSLQ